MLKRTWVKYCNLSKTARIKRGIALGLDGSISIICLVMAVVYGVNGDPYNRLFTCLMAGILLWVPIIVERLAKHRFSFTQHLAFIILLAGGAVAGSIFYLFYLTDWFDCFMHVLAGYVLMIFLLTLQCKKLNDAEDSGFKDKKSALSATLTLLLASLGTACLWELVEFIGDVFFGQTSQGVVPEEIRQMIADQGFTGIRARWEGIKYVSVLDSDLDMLCHAGGSILFCLHYLIHVFTKRNLGMGTLIKDIKGEEMNTAAA